jgi:hypothetical protein
MTVKEILHSLNKNPNQKVVIKGKEKTISGCAEFKSINLGDDTYFKFAFSDHSSLLIVSDLDTLYVSDQPPQSFAEIADNQIGEKKGLLFRGKKFLLDNAHDYQYVVRLIKGDWHTMEGEVRFSDYTAADKSGEMLSLGWIVRTGERADVYLEQLPANEILLA